MPPLTLLLIVYAGLMTLGSITLLVLWMQARERIRLARQEAIQPLTEAQTRLQSLQEQLQRSEEELQAAHRLGTENARLQQQLQDMNQQMQQWEKLKAESLQAARASVLQAGQELSSKLLEDHKRELLQARQESEERTKKTTEGLLQHFQTIEKTVTTLHQHVHEQRGTVDKMWQALANPSAAGNMGEIGLENSLKSFGLEAGRDFMMQYAIRTKEGRQLRPDAVVFLPRETVMVIDSKASTFLLQMAEADSPETRDTALQAVRRSMQAHLRVLASKEYKSTVQEAFKEHRGSAPRRILNVMFVPNEAALEHIYQADSDFMRRAAEMDIIPAGPTGLAGLLALSRIEIDMAQQAENHEIIIDQMQQLLESLATVVGHAASLGKSLKQAAEHFQKFGRSINTRLLPRARRMEQLGVRAAKGKPLPQPIQSFAVLDEALVIDAESENEADTAEPLALTTEAAA